MPVGTESRIAVGHYLSSMHSCIHGSCLSLDNSLYYYYYYFGFSASIPTRIEGVCVAG